MIRKRTVVGNWKMYGQKQQVIDFFVGLRTQIEKESDSFQFEGVICPPVIYLAQAAEWIAQTPGFKLGAQDVSAFGLGAYTGQIAASMLVEHHCQYVILGHSERRQYNHESDAEIAAKFFAAKAAGLIPILCVGETKEQRQANATTSVVLNQLQTILQHQGAAAFDGACIAYEPVWAIGTGLSATPQQVQEVHGLLRKTLAEYDAAIADRISILYGGSVKSSNSAALFELPDVDGALVGGASLQPDEFLAIGKA